MTDPSRDEAAFLAAFLRLRTLSGNHAPSVAEVRQSLGHPVEIDACFLSNPYATDLFVNHFASECASPGRLADLVGSYPSSSAAIAHSLAAVLGVDDDCVFAGNGATEVIQRVLGGYAAGRTLIQVPTFSPYHDLASGEAITYRDLSADPQERAARLRDEVRRNKPDTIVIINPNNPDGFYYQAPVLHDLVAEIAPLVGNIIVDESFAHFVSSSPPPSSVRLNSQIPNLTVIQSLSKAYGIAGVRLGCAVTAPSRVRELRAGSYPWNVNSFAMFFVSLLTDHGYQDAYEQVRRRYVRETRAFFARLAAIPGVRAFPSHANFMLLRLPCDTTEIAARMLFHDRIYVRPCEDKLGLGPGFARVSARREQENEWILRSLARHAAPASRPGSRAPTSGPSPRGQWKVTGSLPADVEPTCLFDSGDWLRAWEDIQIERRLRIAYVSAPGADAGIVPLYLVTHSPFWHGYERQAGLASLADGPLVFAGSTYSMYSKRGAVAATLARGAHATAMDWIAAGDGALLVVPNLTSEGVASWVDAVGEPTGRVLLDRTYGCDTARDFDCHLDRLSHKLRNDVRRRLRRAGERGLRVQMLAGAEASALVPAALPLTVGTTDEHSWPALYDEDALRGLLRVPGAILAAAHVDGRLVGVFFGFRHEREATFLCGGVDYGALPHFSTYVALMYHCTRWAYEQDLQRIEWGRDNYRFKERHGLTGYDLWALVYARQPSRGLSDALTRMRETMCAYIAGAN